MNQTFMDDAEINSKLDFGKPINFLIHGFVSGLLDQNMHLPNLNINPNEYYGVFTYKQVFLAYLKKNRFIITEKKNR